MRWQLSEVSGVLWSAALRATVSERGQRDPVTYLVMLLVSTGLAVPVVYVAIFSPEDIARVHLNCKR